jgi:twitching motility protein PilT
MEIENLLNQAIQLKASDLHLSAGLPPAFRIDGNLLFSDAPNLPHLSILQFLHNVTPTALWEKYRCSFEADFAILHQETRFRVNALKQDRGAAAVLRIIPKQLPLFDDFPAIFASIATYRQGMVLITGPTGSGKTTTLATLINHINQTQKKHVLTIEDPIEFIHTSQKSLINQREVYRDTLSFSAALRAGLREDPDIILIGELRDRETIRLAITAAETGHLVLGTLHTYSAIKAIDRIIDSFSGDEKPMIRSLLAESLRAVIAQQLIPKISGGRAAVYEIMLGTAAIRNLIRENKLPQIYSVLQTGLSQGMQTLDHHLTKLVKTQMISTINAKILATDKDLF